MGRSSRADSCERVHPIPKTQAGWGKANRASRKTARWTPTHMRMAGRKGQRRDTASGRVEGTETKQLLEERVACVTEENKIWFHDP